MKRGTFSADSIEACALEIVPIFGDLRLLGTVEIDSRAIYYMQDPYDVYYRVWFVLCSGKTVHHVSAFLPADKISCPHYQYLAKAHFLGEFSGDR